jgi:hypothetical protein
MAPQRLLRWLTAVVSLTAVGAGTIALHEERVADELGHRCGACDGRPAALADGRRRLDAAQARYAELRARYELRVLEARRDEAALLGVYADARARPYADVPAAVPAGA